MRAPVLAMIYALLGGALWTPAPAKSPAGHESAAAEAPRTDTAAPRGKLRLDDRATLASASETRER